MKSHLCKIQECILKKVVVVTRREKAGVLPVMIKSQSASHIGGFTCCLKECLYGIAKELRLETVKILTCYFSDRAS